MKCVSCKKEFTQGSVFPCPSCLKTKIARCLRCKKLSVPYKCPECDFKGP